MLDRYHHLGALLVGDDESLCRLLTTLEIGARTRSATSVFVHCLTLLTA